MSCENCKHLIKTTTDLKCKKTGLYNIEFYMESCPFFETKENLINYCAGRFRYKSEVKLPALVALNYLEDIAQGRKIDYDPHDLEQIVEKIVVAVEIVNKKRVNIDFLLRLGYEDYNIGLSGERKIWDTEYNLLKEVFGNGL